jgi:hypothetical protein
MSIDESEASSSVAFDPSLVKLARSGVMVDYGLKEHGREWINN